MEPAVYDTIWKSFSTGDHISQGSIWGGAGLALIVAVDRPDVIGKIGQVQSYLAAELAFTPLPSETLHITIALLGTPPDERLAALSTSLRTALAPLAAFRVQLKRVNSFFRAPFFEVQDAGALNLVSAAIRPGLAELGFPGMDYGPNGQVWHVTLGGYTKSGDGAAARRLLGQLRDESAGGFTVGELRLVKTSPSKPYRMDMIESFLLPGPEGSSTETGKST